MTDVSVSSPALVRCEAVSRTFGTGRRAVVAVHCVTCAVESGGRVAIMGPSGSGKSTLLHLLGGLESPTSGRISWPALPDGSSTLEGGIALVFQGASLMPALTVVENVAFPLLLQRFSDPSARDQAVDALTTLGIDDLAGKLPEELSGGQAQRVAVARVLASRPRLILADEPTGRLDHAAGGLVIDVLTAAADELGAGLVVSTHDPTVADRFSTRWRMTDGSLEIATPTPLELPA